MNKATFILSIEGDGDITKARLEPLADEIKVALTTHAQNTGLVDTAAEAVYTTGGSEDIPKGTACSTEKITVEVAT